MAVKFFFVTDINEFTNLDTRHIQMHPFLKENLKVLEDSGQTDLANYYKYALFLKTGLVHIFRNMDDILDSEPCCETGIPSVKFDFNFGLRLDIPEGNYHVKIGDYDSEQIFFDEDVSDVRLVSSHSYYIHWHFEISKDGEKIFEHTFEPAQKEVLLVIYSPTLGDNVSFLPYIKEFQKIHGCKIKLYVTADYLKKFFAYVLPDVEQVNKFSYDYYATFYLSAFLGDRIFLPEDSRAISLERVGGLCLGINRVPPPIKFIPSKNRQIKTPYVCIAIQASGVIKSWLYPRGWDIVVDYLLSLGYRVLCIDQRKLEVDNFIGGTIITSENLKRQKILLAPARFSTERICFITQNFLSG